ncbi:MAG: L-ribulose-5-phosphate 4-epimerase [Desulfosarcinaceae bacterium]|nr:L-ribulose-5-phosphate 4-epimerase [Desulfosarcinaceae bacterium]
MQDDLKQAVLDANLLLKELGLVIFTWGNVSAIDRDRGEVLIKPSGVSYETMRLADLVMVDLDGNILDGAYKPSSDLATHLEIYRRFPACGAVVHTHSRLATAWAQAGIDLPACGTTHADYFYGPVPCTRPLTREEIQGAYELETGRVIAETFEERGIDPAQVPAVLVNSHGPFTWGTTPEKAVHNTVVLEEVASMAFYSRLINPQMGAMDQALLDRHFLRKHGANAYYGQQ